VNSFFSPSEGRAAYASSDWRDGIFLEELTGVPAVHLQFGELAIRPFFFSGSAMHERLGGAEPCLRGIRETSSADVTETI
jgi:hypothetical protein